LSGARRSRRRSEKRRGKSEKRKTRGKSRAFFDFANVWQNCMIFANVWQNVFRARRVVLPMSGKFGPYLPRIGK
jgi:hypothetical protein